MCFSNRHLVPRGYVPSAALLAFGALEAQPFPYVIISGKVQELAGDVLKVDELYGLEICI
jgi:hypothetical protein